MKKKSSQHELTLRGFLLGAVLTILFIAANVYLGLTIGMTFSTSIPAAIISMTCFSALKKGNILENNIVQTIASSGGTLSAVIFALPGLAMINVWAGFPFWQSTLVCMLGGLFGVLFTIPLRRALVVDSDLPYPEGTAAAELLRLPLQEANEATQETPLKDILYSTSLAFIFSLFSKGFHWMSSGFSVYGSMGSIVTGTSASFDFALIGAGYLIGIRIGLTILIGTALAWLIGVPLFSLGHLGAHPHFAHYAQALWGNKVRYIGVGTIGIAAIWSIVQLIKPVIKSIHTSIQHTRQYDRIESHEKDMPITWVAILSMVLIFPLIALFIYFLLHGHTNFSTSFLITLAIICAFLAIGIGFIVAAASGFMAGLVGSSNSPISGIAIIGTVIIALILSLIFHSSPDAHNLVNLKYVIAMAIFTTSAVVSMAAISNDNLQDLKTGYLIKASPWKQQLALMFGVIIGSFVIAPVLNQLYQAYGFVGALPHPGMDPHLALSAPQATVISTLAKGIIGESIDWSYILMGVALGIVILIINTLLQQKNKHRISVFSMGIGIYLPPAITLPLFIGSFISYCVYRSLQDHSLKPATERRGTLFASGLIVGDSIFGILLAVIITITGSQTPLNLASVSFQPIAKILGILVFLAIVYYFYSYVSKLARPSQGSQ